MNLYYQYIKSFGGRLKSYGMILLSPSTIGLAEKLVAEHCEKIALIEVDMENKRGSKLDKTGSRDIGSFIRWFVEVYNIKFEDITWPFKYGGGYSNTNTPSSCC